VSESNLVRFTKRKPASVDDPLAPGMIEHFVDPAEVLDVVGAVGGENCMIVTGGGWSFEVDCPATIAKTKIEIARQAMRSAIATDDEVRHEGAAPAPVPVVQERRKKGYDEDFDDGHPPGVELLD
jgi:hypothetical protein